MFYLFERIFNKKSELSKEDASQTNLWICFRLVELRFKDRNPEIAERMANNTTTVGDLDEIRKEFIAIYLDPKCVSHREGVKEAYDWIADRISAKTENPADCRQLLSKMWVLETTPPEALRDAFTNVDQ